MVGCWSPRRFGNRLRFVYQEFEGQFVFIPDNVQGSIQPLTEDDLGAWRRQGSVRLQQLDELGVEGDGPIIIDVSDLFDTKDIVEVNVSGRAMNVGEAIGVSKALVVSLEICSLEEAIGLFNG